MFSTYTTLTLIISSSVGMLVGFLVGYKTKFPKTQKMFWLTIFLFFISPSIGIRTYLFGDATSGTLRGLAVAPLLVCFFLMLNVMYIFRQVSMTHKSKVNKLA